MTYESELFSSSRCIIQREKFVILFIRVIYMSFFQKILMENIARLRAEVINRKALPLELFEIVLINYSAFKDYL